MAKAGADVLIPHMGLTTKGSIGAQTALTLDEAAQRVQAMHDAARSVSKDILVLCHGGPISEPEDAQYILRHTQGNRRLLRRVEHRTAADGDGHHGLRAPLQGHRLTGREKGRRGRRGEGEKGRRGELSAPSPFLPLPARAARANTAKSCPT